MRLLLAFVVLACLPATGAFAIGQSIAQQTCDSSYESLSNFDKDKVPYQGFITRCEETRHSWEAAPNFTPDKSLSFVTGICSDNTYTTAIIRANACTENGGVSMWFAGIYAPPRQEPSQSLPQPPEPEKSRPKPVVPDRAPSRERTPPPVSPSTPVS